MGFPSVIFLLSGGWIPPLNVAMLQKTGSFSYLQYCSLHTGTNQYAKVQTCHMVCQLSLTCTIVNYFTQKFKDRYGFNSFFSLAKGFSRHSALGIALAPTFSSQSRPGYSTSSAPNLQKSYPSLALSPAAVELPRPQGDAPKRP